MAGPEFDNTWHLKITETPPRISANDRSIILISNEPDKGQRIKEITTGTKESSLRLLPCSNKKCLLAAEGELMRLNACYVTCGIGSKVSINIYCNLLP